LFINTIDIAAPGKEPTYFGKNYFNMLTQRFNEPIPYLKRRDRYAGWEHHIYAYIAYDRSKDKKERRLDVYEPSGVRQSYSFRKFKKLKKKDSEKFKKWKFGNSNLSFHNDEAGKKAFVNTSRGQISAKTNYRRNIVEKIGDRQIRVWCVDGTIRNYKRYDGGDERYHLDNEILPNGNRIKYCMCSAWFHPIRIESLSPAGRVYSKVTINYSRDLKDQDETKPLNETVKISTHTGKTLECKYNVEESDKNYPCFVLKNTNSYYGQTNIEHISHSVFFLNEYRAPQNRALIFNYCLGNKYSKNYKKISEIKMLKNNSHAFTTHSFTYEANHTTVKDGLGNDTKYYYNSDNFRLDKIERHQNINGSQHLKNLERFIWGSDEKAGFLLGKVIYNENREPIKGERYDYDRENTGNIIKKTIYGNITNSNPISIQLASDSLPVHNGIDTNIEEYTHTQNGSIQSELKQNGLKTEYAYLICKIDGIDFHTNLISSKLTKFEGEIKQRFFYEYDEHNVLIKEIEDDGSAENKDDLTNVSRRLIKKYKPRDTEPFGLTQTYKELYLDLETNEEKLIKKEIYDYSIDCNMTKKDVYGSNKNLKYSLTYQYDHKDNLTYEKDPIERAAHYQYDESNNKIYEKDFSGKETYFQFDNCNRLIKKVIKDKQKEYVEEYGYDAKHNKIYEKDIYGNITRFEYDCIGNKTKEILPSVEDTFGTIEIPVITYRYDALSRQIEKKDAKGNISKTSYNLFNKPILIEHPDGIKEQYFYNLDNTLNTYVNQLGTKTKYDYDYLQRVVSKKIYSSDEKLLQEEYFEYNAFELISKKDATGNITTYTYDKAGRKIKEEFFFNKNKLLSIEEYFYNSLGFIEKKIEGHELITTYQLDNIGRVKKVKRLNNEHKLLFKQKYQYDAADNKIEIISYITAIEDNIRKKCKVIAYRDYDVFKRLIRTKDSFENETNIIYEEDIQNKIIQKTIENPLRQKIISTYDTLNREKTIKHLSPDGNILSFEEKFYDLNNNLTRQVSHIYNSPKEAIKKVTTFWKYDSMNKPILLTEAYGTDDEKTTEYIYINALLHKTIKPDKTILKYKYDALSNQIELKSKNSFQSSNEEDQNLSNKQIHYKFTYNKLNQLTLVEDVTLNKTTHRKYDAKNRLLKEKQASGLVIKNKYDLLGNKIKCTYPDKSFVEYLYDPINLKKVIRTTSYGDRYEHAYTCYDLSGNLLQEKLIKDEGFINYHLDKLQRVLIIDSPYHSQNITYDEIGRITNIKWQNFLNDENFYSYDDLNQITNETGLFSNNYEFDSHFNRLSKNEDLYEINDLNEILSTNQRIFEYDKNGNPIIKKSDNEEIRFFYDDLDRLIKVEKPNEHILKFKYDSFNRRISKKVLTFCPSYIGNSKFEQRVFRYFLYDDQNEIGSFNKNLKQKELRILGNSKKAEIGSAISFEIKGFIYAPIYDISGNLTSLVFKKSISEHYRYSAFGEEKIYNYFKSEISNSSIKNPWRFSSKRIDEETNLVYYGRRYYDPEIGRWLTPDPQGFTDGLNLYVFVNNDPLINFDLYGLRSYKDEYEPRVLDKIGDAGNNSNIYLINGQFNTREEAQINGEVLYNTVKHISKSMAVTPIHTGTRGVITDSITTIFQRLGFFEPKRINMIRNIMATEAERSKNNNLKSFFVDFSRGGLDTHQALKGLSQEQRDQLIVLNAGFAKEIPKNLGYIVRNIKSDGDPIPTITHAGTV
nr:putative deoxyribonuclease RhsB [Candidatus Anoxychlamydiales bacterium]